MKYISDERLQTVATKYASEFVEDNCKVGNLVTASIAVNSAAHGFFMGVRYIEDRDSTIWRRTLKIIGFKLADIEFDFNKKEKISKDFALKYISIKYPHLDDRDKELAYVSYKKLFKKGMDLSYVTF